MAETKEETIPEHLKKILGAETQEAIRTYNEAQEKAPIYSFQFVFPCNTFSVGSYIFPFAQQNQEHLLSYKFKWERNKEGPKVVVGSDLWYRPVQEDVGSTLTFLCLDSEEKIEVEKLTTEPVVASSQPIEKPRCFVAQSQLMGEVQYIENKLHTKNLGRVTGMNKSGSDEVVITTDCDFKFELAAISPQIWRFELKTQSTTIPPGPSYSVLESSAKSREPLVYEEDSKKDSFEVRLASKQSGTHLAAKVHTSPLRVEYQLKKDSASTTIQMDGKTGIKWLADTKRNFAEISLELGEGVQMYGLGERTTLKKNNRKFYMWNDDAYAYRTHTDPLYHCYPFVIFIHPKTSLFHAFYLDNPGFQIWNCTDNAITISALNGLSPLRYYVMVGESPQEILRNYTFLTGRMPLPPLWVLGYQQCRWSYYPDARVREVASGFRERDIPCDVLWLDIDYMDGFRCFTWDKERFPSPKDLIEWLHAQKFKVICMIDPAIKEDPKYWVYKELVEGKHFCALDASLQKPYIGSVWAGPSVFPDYTQPHTREWWGGLYKEMVGMGVDGFWNDMNEPTIFHKKEDSVAGWVHHAEGTHRDIHNLYGMLMARSTYEGLYKLQPNERPFVLTRAGCAGVQRYAWMWTGDNRSIWKDLQLSIPMCLGMGLSGVAGCGVDIGGFSETCTPELFARFVELGSLLPLSRAHSMTGTPDHEPWSFGKEVQEIAQKHIKLRYKLIPYLYTQLHLATKEGTPIMRPIWFDREGDTESYEKKWEDTEFILGKSILVAPVLQEGATKREVYLPSGNRWVNFYTKKIEEGGQVVTVDAPLSELPLFVAEGSVIPMYKEAKENIHESRKTGLEFLAFGENKEKCEGEIYIDDGESRSFQTGECAVYKITQSGISWNGPPKCLLCLDVVEKGACKKCGHVSK